MRIYKDHKVKNKLFARNKANNRLFTAGVTIPTLSGSLSFNLPVYTLPIGYEIHVEGTGGVKAVDSIISPANKDGKFDTATIKVTAFKDDKWRLTIKGADENGQARRYELEGQGNQDVSFFGMTNDGLSPISWTEYIT